MSTKNADIKLAYRRVCAYEQDVCRERIFSLP